MLTVKSNVACTIVIITAITINSLFCTEWQNEKYSRKVNDVTHAAVF